MQYLNQSLFAPPAASYMTRLITALRYPDPVAFIREILLPELGVFDNEIYVPVNAGCPAWYAARSGEVTVLVVDGASLLSHFTGIVDGWSGVLQSGYRDPYNDWFQRNSGFIRNRLQEARMWQVQTLKAAGWSAGGGIVEHLGDFSEINTPYWPTTDIVTFGAPRPFGDTIRRACEAHATITRYMNDEDPVPLCPPRLADLPALPFAIGIRAANRWGNFMHPITGWKMTAEGFINASALPSAAGVRMVVSLASWLYEFRSGLEGPHSIWEYQRRLNVHGPFDRPPAPPRVDIADHTREVPVQQMNRAERQAFRDVLVLQQRQNEAPLIIPGPDKFKHEKLGRQHFVSFRGQVIASSTSKRKMIGIARDLNDMFKRLQTAALVDTKALRQTIETYLDEAADPAGDFSPIMSTDWNQGAL